LTSEIIDPHDIPRIVEIPKPSFTVKIEIVAAIVNTHKRIHHFLTVRLVD